MLEVEYGDDPKIKQFLQLYYDCEDEWCENPNHLGGELKELSF